MPISFTTLWDFVVYSWYCIHSCSGLRLGSQMSRLRHVTRQMLVYLSTYCRGRIIIFIDKAFHFKTIQDFSRIVLSSPALSQIFPEFSRANICSLVKVSAIREVTSSLVSSRKKKLGNALLSFPSISIYL